MTRPFKTQLRNTFVICERSKNVKNQRFRRFTARSTISQLPSLGTLQHAMWVLKDIATFQDVKRDILPKGHLPEAECLSVVDRISAGFEKINFAGGEQLSAPGYRT